MVRYLHYVTVGTSILRNAVFLSSSYAVLSRHREVLERWSRAAPDSYDDVEAGKHARESSEIFNDVYTFVAENPLRASAELNAMFKYVELLRSRGIEGVVHDVVLFPTDTGTSRFCALIIKKFLRENFSEKIYPELRGHSIGYVDIKEVKGFGHDFWRGLLNLLNTIAKHMRSIGLSGYDRVLANLTAGFKPETAFVLLISSLIGIDSAYYIHEYMRGIVEIPILSLKLSDVTREMLEKISRGEKLVGNLGRVAERMGLAVRGRPLPEAVELAKILVTLTTR